MSFEKVQSGYVSQGTNYFTATSYRLRPSLTPLTRSSELKELSRLKVKASSTSYWHSGAIAVHSGAIAVHSSAIAVHSGAAVKFYSNNSNCATVLKFWFSAFSCFENCLKYFELR